jgi:hypothetical protein
MRTLLVFTLWVRLALTSLEELFSQHAPFLIIRSDDSSGPQIFVSDSTALAARWCRAYRTNVDERESERLFLQRVSTGLDIYTGDQISSAKAVRGIFRLKLAQNITRLVLKLAHSLRARALSFSTVTPSCKLFVLTLCRLETHRSGFLDLSLRWYQMFRYIEQGECLLRLRGLD